MIPHSSRRWWAAFAAIAAVGTVLKLWLAGNAGRGNFDIQSWLVMGEALRDNLLHAYDTGRYPYPPGFLPWLFMATSGTVDDAIGFDYVFRLPMIAADLATAWLVQDYLQRHGAGPRTRLAAAGLIVLGPVFVAVSGHHGQIDPIAILPAVAAVWVWDRDGEHRALVAGVLIGLGAALKSVPIFVLIPLLPWIRSRAEAVKLVAPALAIPLILVAPFLAANWDGTFEALRQNRGFPGLGGVSLLIARYWDDVFGSGAADVLDFLTDAQQVMVLLALLATALILWRRRLPPAQGAALIWLAVFAATPHFTWHYLIWGLPFFLMAGFVREVAIFQLLAIVPLWIFYQPEPPSDTVFDAVYFPLALGLYLALIVALVLALRSIRRQGPPRSSTLSSAG